jgi:7-cyano-7-deazaguanine reductase
MTQDINKIAGKHLGKAGDGTAVNPYITPDSHNPELLVPVPRSINREDYDLKEGDLPFCGMDMWNAYEVSFLLDNGYPVSGVARIMYTCFSKSIVESKSLKLYLNSFNMEPLGKTITAAAKRFETLVTEHLTAAVGGAVRVRFYSPVGDVRYFTPNFTTTFDDDTTHSFYRIEKIVDVKKLVFDQTSEAPQLLKTRENPIDRSGIHPQLLTTNALRSNCRVTNQPDWGDVYLVVEGKTVVDPASFLQYIVSMRKENHFHEEICEMIFKRLKDLLPPKTGILVMCLYTRRGGIDINPVRATNKKLIQQYTDFIFDVDAEPFKTLRQ